MTALDNYFIERVEYERVTHWLLFPAEGGRAHTDILAQVNVWHDLGRPTVNLAGIEETAGPEPEFARALAAMLGLAADEAEGKLDD